VQSLNEGKVAMYVRIVNKLDLIKWTNSCQ